MLSTTSLTRTAAAARIAALSALATAALLTPATAAAMALTGHLAPIPAPLAVPAPAVTCHLDSPARLSGSGTLLEDQAPFTGACGGVLVSFNGDTATADYSDGSVTDGNSWTLTGGE
ncbi:membrane protein [Gordonia phage Camerico]|nr:membrane protein [Gordonia phage Camerico]